LVVGTVHHSNISVPTVSFAPLLRNGSKRAVLAESSEN
jgi:hypothetical protein